MVSSTFADIVEHRAAAIKILERADFFPRVMENDAAKPDGDVIDSSLQMVRDSAAYMGVITHRYGQTPKCPMRNPDELSLTELEFREAQRLNRPILLFMMGEDHPGRRSDFEQDSAKIVKLEAFRQLAKIALVGGNVERVYSTFNSLDDFKDAAATSVAALSSFFRERQPTYALENTQPVSPVVLSLDQHSAGTAQIRTVDRHEPRPEIFGRETELRFVTEGLLSGNDVLIGGGPGFGKTALALTALYHSDIVARFGVRRVFISLDTVPDAITMLVRCVEAFGYTPANDEASLLVQLERAIGSEPAVIALDNAETVFESDRSHAERLTRLMAQIDSLHLLITMRGVTPQIADAAVLGDLGRLDSDAARDAFLRVAGPSFATDDALNPILEAIEGHALSLQIVAAHAAGTSTLAGLRARWEEERATILRKPYERENRLTSVRASLALSLKSPAVRSSPITRRVLSVIAHLPGGLLDQQAYGILCGHSTVTRARLMEAVGALEKLKLVERKLDGRLRMITPLREAAKADLPLNPQDRAPLVRLYMQLASQAIAIGSAKWQEVEEKVTGDLENLEAAAHLAIEKDLPNAATFKGIHALAELARFTISISLNSVIEAADRYLRSQSYNNATTLYLELGDISINRLDHESAQRFLDLADECIVRSRNLSFQPMVDMNRARIAIDLSDDHGADYYINRALDSARKYKDTATETDILMIKTTIVMRTSRPSDVREYLEEALSKNSGRRHNLGRANALLQLAKVEPDRAEGLLMEAITVFRNVGAATSLVGGLHLLGKWMLFSGNPTRAAELFGEALGIARAQGTVGLEAEILVYLGRALKVLGLSEESTRLIDSGFRLWLKVSPKGDPTLQGWQAMREVYRSPREALRWKGIAREAWEEIGRYDLIREWLDEVWG